MLLNEKQYARVFWQHADKCRHCDLYEKGNIGLCNQYHSTKGNVCHESYPAAFSLPIKRRSWLFKEVKEVEAETIEFRGVRYIRVPEIGISSCYGCVFANLHDDCPQQAGEIDCRNSGLIYRMADDGTN